MSSLRGGVPATLTTRVQLSSRTITTVLIAALAAAVLALSIALAVSTGGSQDGAPVRVAPAPNLPPSPAERDQPPGLLGPGMNP
jgi:hypothetical protein